jgi:hypothetical protein
VKPEAEEQEAPKEERVDCICGVRGSAEAESGYAGLWVQCDACAAWLHGACLGMKRPPAGGPCRTFLLPLLSSAVHQISQIAPVYSFLDD